jgi:hypothetical protein
MILFKSTSDRTAMWHSLPTEKLVDVRIRLSAGDAVRRRGGMASGSSCHHIRAKGRAHERHQVLFFLCS